MRYQLGLPILAAAMALACAACAQPRTVATPEAVGLDSAEIAAVLETVHRKNIPLDSLYIERDGRAVLDLYVYPYAPTLRHDVASVSKSVTALTVGALFAQRPDFGMDQVIAPVGEIRMGDALSMRTGLACGDRPGEPELFAVMASPNWAEAAASLPRHSPPGAAFSYCSPAYLLASAFVTRATHASLASQAQRLIFEPLGITNWRWPADPQGHTRGWGDLDLLPGDLAKIGRMLLDHGAYEGRQVVPGKWISKATTAQSDASKADGYGYGFWLRKSVPGLIEGRGRGGQGVIAWPDQKLLIVMTASDTDDGQTLPLLAGLKPRSAPLPPNPASVARLTRAVEALAKPPAPQAPGMAGRFARPLLGRPLLLADTQWIRRLTLRQAGALGSLRIESPYYTFEVPLGFDGVPRLGEHGPEDGAVSGRATWIDPDHLVVEVRPYALAQRVTLDIAFTTAGATISAREASGLFAFHTTARPDLAK